MRNVSRGSGGEGAMGRGEFQRPGGIVLEELEGVL